jgi:hypothetical protein
MGAVLCAHREEERLVVVDESCVFAGIINWFLLLKTASIADSSTHAPV